jgi:hypothetical protein
MAKFLRLFLISFTTFCFASRATAQCPFTGTVQTTESRCKESGTITINMSPAAPYAYQIIAGPRKTAITSVNVFSGLPNGTYTIAVTLGGCSVFYQATVAGNYQEPSLLSATVKNIACPQGFGSITANQPLNGRQPYQYALVSGPVTRSAQNSAAFNNLPAGTYTLQAFDSCGVVRTSNYAIAYDTGTFTAYTYGYDLRYDGCSNLVVCPITGFNNTRSHSQMMIWYIKPNGDTLKVNNFETFPASCDTLIGEAHTYGNWKMLSFDTCGRKVVTAFQHLAPTVLSVNLFKISCNGAIYNMTNLWKYGQNVGYRIRRCSDNSIVHDTIQTPATTFYSPNFLLDFNTCYYFEHWNSCGDTVRRTFTTVAKPAFKVQACEATACSVVGKGAIVAGEVYLTGAKPITFTIIAGPEGVGMTAVQTQYSSYVYLRDLAMGTYTVAAQDSCGNKDTVTITLTKPLIRTLEITKTPNCGAGADVHVKVTSNYTTCAMPVTDTRNITYVTTTAPYRQALNVTTVAPTASTQSIWEADYFNVPNGNFYLQTFMNADGCNWDTTVVIDGYVAPVLNSATGYLCEASGMGLIDYTLTGGKNPYSYRIRPQGTNSWGIWQSGTVFSGINIGTYDVNVQDSCPNGSITSVSFQPWEKSNISVKPLCAVIGQPVTLTANPNIDGINYEWFFNGVLVGVGANLTIPNFQSNNNGTYTLMQSFPGGPCKDSAKLPVFDCLTLPVSITSLKGEFVGDDVKLSWRTQQEEAGLYFEIEKSINGVNFKKIQTVVGTNSTSGKQYSFVDDNAADVNFYRIKYTTANGKVAYTNVVKLSTANIVIGKLSVSPNPSHADVAIHFSASKAGNYVMQITDATGKVVYKQQKATVAGANTFLLNETNVSLQSGIYIVEVRGNNQLFTQKIIRY